MNTNLLKRLTATTAAVALLACVAQATPVTPGNSVVPNTGTDPLTGTTILGNTGVQNFSVSGGAGQTFSGTGQEWAIRNYASNPFGPNAISFVLQVSLNPAPPNSPGQVIERVTNAVFDSFLTDVMFFAQNVGQVNPGTADRSSTGNQVGFNFLGMGDILPGQTSALLIINTNATGFTLGTLTVQDGLTANLNGFAPVPESGASSAVLLLVGIGAMAFASSRLLKGSKASA